MSFAIETLERRSLLSVTLDGGVLRIVGTEGADRVLFAPAPGLNPEEGTPLLRADSEFTVKFNDEVFLFKANDIRRVKVNLKDGNDFFGYECVPGDFWRDPLLIPIEPIPLVLPKPFTDLPVVVRGGSGDDRLVTGNGNDRAYGGKGDDKISTGRGDDELRGNAGNDHLSRRRGNDKLFSGYGADTLLGSQGEDELFSTNQTDVSDGGGGSNTIWALAVPAARVPRG